MRSWHGPSRPVAQRTVLVAAAMLLGACGSSAVQSGSTGVSAPVTTTDTSTTGSTLTGSVSPGSAVCGPGAAHTLAAGASARVYASGGQAYGCARGGRGRYSLGGLTTCLRSPLAGPFAVAGVRVAYGVARCGVDTGRSTVVVRALDTGRVLSDQTATSSPLGAESYVRVTAIVLSAGGDVAWITQAGSIVGHRRATEVHVLDARGNRLLARGGGIDPRSLRLTGRQLRWRDGSHWRTTRIG